uniref:Uncharacterized protein n=3 Tax=Meloidogyne TaxID=189290 RepID=A0A915N667_MELJA
MVCLNVIKLTSFLLLINLLILPILSMPNSENFELLSSGKSNPEIQHIEKRRRRGTLLKAAGGGKMIGFSLVKLTCFLLLINLLLIPVLTMPSPESFVPMNLNVGELGSEIQPIEKRRRRRGTLLKGLAGGAAAGLGAALLYKAFKKKN